MSGSKMNIPVSVRTHAIGAVLFVLPLAGGYWFGVRPAAAAQASEDRERVEIDGLKAQLAERKSTERALRAELDELRTLTDDWSRRVGPARSVNERVASIAALAEDHSLTLHTLQPGSRVPSEFFDVQQLAVGGEGSYAEVAAFFRAVLNAFPDVTIDGFELVSSGPGTDAAGTFKCDFALYLDRAGAGATPSSNPG